MRVAIIGRTEILYETAMQLQGAGHEVVCVLTAKEAPEYTRTSANFEAMANQLGAPFANGGAISRHDEFLKSAKADIAVSINYTGVIPQHIIDLFPMGILNAHGGDLPRYRGNACQAWAIINGEKRIGLCIHRMIGGELDSGDIIARDYFPLSINTKVTEVYGWMGERTPELFIDAIKQLADDPSYVLERQSKIPKDILRCYPRKPEDGRIDWRKSNMEILRLINACNKPYSGAFCDLEGQKLIIWDAELAPEETFLSVPGQVAEITETYVDVATGNGKLRVREVEFGGIVVRSGSFCRSIRQRFQ